MNKIIKDELLRMRSPKRIAEIFSFICFDNFMQGQFNGNMPVDDSREVFEHLKKLIIKEHEEKRG